jgi:hypothetical protein
MKYGIKGIAKAIAGFVFPFIGYAYAKSGGDVSTLDLSAWLEALMAGLGGSGLVFATPNKDVVPVTDKAVTSLQDVRKELESTIAAANENLQSVVDNVTKVQQTVGGGELVDRVIQSYRP